VCLRRPAVTGLTIADPAFLAAAAASVFDPASLSPILWLDAADTSTITQSGGKVSQWNNKGSLGAFTQSTGTAQPTTGASTQNGKNVLTFANSWMNSSNTAASYKPLSDGTNYIVAAAWRAGSSSNPNALGVLLDNADASFSNIGMSVFYDDRSAVPRNDFIAHLVTRGGGGSGAVNNSQNNAFAANTFAALTILAQPSNGTAADRSRLFINNGSVIANNVSTSAVNTGNPTQVLRLGNLSTTSIPLTGAVGEVIIVTGANATETNRQALVTYLNAKWAMF
jgi:hypothetical protein